MNNLLFLGGQECTDNVNVQESGNGVSHRDRLVIIPHLSFNCNSRITSIRARLWFSNVNSDYPFFQVWRPVSVDSTAYSKIG